MFQVIERVDAYIGDESYSGPLEWVYVGQSHETREKAELFAVNRYGPQWADLQVRVIRSDE